MTSLNTAIARLQIALRRDDGQTMAEYAVILAVITVIAIERVLDTDRSAAFALAAVGIALPALTYLFLSSLWLLLAAQRLLPGAR